MPEFRNLRPDEAARPITLAQVRELIAECVRPAHFFVGPALTLEWEHAEREEIAWEVFRGRLLDPAHTRRRKIFESWNVFQADSAGRSAEPLLAVKLDDGEQQIHVTRAIYSYAWEGYHAGDNVYLSRETPRWVTELVGSIDLRRFDNLAELRDELMCMLFQAVIGVSRLPLTSVEAPLPQFSLGQLGYVYRTGHDEAPPLRSCRALITEGGHAELSRLEQVKLLETLLRSASASEIDALADEWATRWQELGQARSGIPTLFRQLFDEVALSPYTEFVPHTLAFLRALTQQQHLSAAEHVDFLGYLLRQLARHLTAYDLKVFHHQGANYPDALLLDTVLKEYLAYIERAPELFDSSADDDEQAQARKRARRRALRQGWLLRRYYEGLLVPDAPTSPGENARVLPAPHVRVPDEQIVMAHKRSKHLYDGDPLAQHLSERGQAMLALSMRDLAEPEELRELGLAVFLDRPLGVFKAPGGPDQTPLLSYESFSRSIAEQRLSFLAQELALIPTETARRSQAMLKDMQVEGMPLPSRPGVMRPGTVALDDACRVADDFIVLRTTRRSVREFFELFGLAASLPLEECRLILRGDHDGLLVVFDMRLRPRLELQFDPSAGYESRAGKEIPRGGVRFRRVG